MPTPIQIQKRFTSRSAVICYNACHLKRFLQYHLGGTGYVPEKASLDLLIGTTVHRGIQHLLEHCRVEHPDGNFEEACVDEAVNKAKEIYREVLSESSLWLHNNEEQYLSHIIAEQECLFEGLIRAFALRKLPQILSEYIVLEVEKEEVMEDFSENVIFLGKADGLLQRRVDNKLVVLSLKTSSEYPEVTQRNILHDMQGKSEWALVEDRLEKDFEKYKTLRIAAQDGKDSTDAYRTFRNQLGIGLANYFKGIMLAQGYNGNQKPKVFAVVYEHLLKGRRLQNPPKSGIYQQNSFLVHPLKSDSIMLIGGQNVTLAPDDYRWKRPSGRLPKGLNQINIWDDIGIKNWVDILNTGLVQPEFGHPFDEILRTSDLIVRSPEEIEEWKVSTAFQEETIAQHLCEIELAMTELNTFDDEQTKIEHNKMINRLLWQYFPKNTESCHDYYGKDCAFTGVCHEGLELSDSISAGIFVQRISHHDMEREALENK